MCFQLETVPPGALLSFQLRDRLDVLNANYRALNDGLVLLCHGLVLHLDEVLLLADDEVAFVEVRFLEEGRFVGFLVEVAAN